MRTFYIKRGDTAPDLEVTRGPAEDVDLSGATVVFNMKFKDGAVKVPRGPATIVSVSPPVLSYAWDFADTTEAGDFVGEFEVTYASGDRETFPNEGNSYIPIVIGEDIA